MQFVSHSSCGSDRFPARLRSRYRRGWGLTSRLEQGREGLCPAPPPPPPMAGRINFLAAVTWPLAGWGLPSAPEHREPPSSPKLAVEGVSRLSASKTVPMSKRNRGRTAHQLCQLLLVRSESVTGLSTRRTRQGCEQQGTATTRAT